MQMVSLARDPKGENVFDKSSDITTAEISLSRKVSVVDEAELKIKQLEAKVAQLEKKKLELQKVSLFSVFNWLINIYLCVV